jgi:hypothetical protein
MMSFMWVCNLVCHGGERTYTEGVFVYTRHPHGVSLHCVGKRHVELQYKYNTVYVCFLT